MSRLTEADRLATALTSVSRFNDTESEPVKSVEPDPGAVKFPDEDDERLPKMMVYHKRDASIEAPILALVLRNKDICYVEMAFSSATPAHAVEAIAQEGVGDWYYNNPDSGSYECGAGLTRPVMAVVADARILIPGDKRTMHHVAIQSGRGDLLFVRKGTMDLWNKVREKMSCPTLPSWGERLLPGIKKQVVDKCQCWGLGDIEAYVLKDGAEAAFDALVTEVMGTGEKADPIAEDLNSFLLSHGAELAIAAKKMLSPVFDPEKQPLLDLSELEVCRSKKSGTPFKFETSQTIRVTAGVNTLKKYRACWLVVEPGGGKTVMSLAMCHKLLEKRKEKKPFRAIVMCPGHLVLKWQREAQWIIPKVEARVIAKAADMIRFRHDAQLYMDRPMVAIISKDIAKLGYNVNAPSAAKHMAVRTVRHFMRSGERLPKGMKFAGWERYGPYGNERDWAKVLVRTELACCPHCSIDLGNGKRTPSYAVDKNGEPMSHAEYIASERPQVCSNCGQRMATEERSKGSSRMHLDRYVQRHMKGVFDVLIADEAHELSAHGTAQGNTLGTLRSACKYAIILTGTLIGGKASDMHALLWRVTPKLMRDRGFKLLKHSTMGAIARNEMSFVRDYGIIERQVIKRCDGDDNSRVRYGRTSRKKDVLIQERVRPGISPNLFNDFLLGTGIFMRLAEMDRQLPTLDRVLTGVKMHADQQEAYEDLEEQFDRAKSLFEGRPPPAFGTIRVMALDAWSDKCYGWENITCPTWGEEGRGEDMVIASPKDLGHHYIGAKDVELVKLCKQEARQERKCAVFVQYTNRHNVRDRLEKLLKDAGLRPIVLNTSSEGGPSATKREEWIEKHQDSVDVLICHPRLVMTGLDLLAFPTIIWHQTGYSTHVLRQASCRHRRPNQTQPCKTFYTYNADTVQATAMKLMGEKESASLSLEGVFDPSALRALMNGGEDDDILGAVAKRLGEKSDPTKAWSAIIKAREVAKKTAAVAVVVRSKGDLLLEAAGIKRPALLPQTALPVVPKGVISAAVAPCRIRYRDSMGWVFEGDVPHWVRDGLVAKKPEAREYVLAMKVRQQDEAVRVNARQVQSVLF